MRNLEYKARVDDLKRVSSRARELGADLWGDLRHTDTYFAVPQGRLKLRQTAGFQAELIFYDRDEQAESRPSDYEIAHSPEPDALLNVLRQALGVLVVVRKRRTLLLLDSTRIHLDNVEGLGSYVEIEVAVREDENAARERLERLIRELGLSWGECIRASYVDLLQDGGDGFDNETARK